LSVRVPLAQMAHLLCAHGANRALTFAAPTGHGHAITAAQVACSTSTSLTLSLSHTVPLSRSLTLTSLSLCQTLPLSHHRGSAGHTAPLSLPTGLLSLSLPTGILYLYDLHASHSPPVVSPSPRRWPRCTCTPGSHSLTHSLSHTESITILFPFCFRPQVAMLHQHVRLFAWLAATADWATPLHHLNIVTPERARSLLR